MLRNMPGRTFKHLVLGDGAKVGVERTGTGLFVQIAPPGTEIGAHFIAIGRYRVKGFHIIRRTAGGMRMLQFGATGGAEKTGRNAIHVMRQDAQRPWPARQSFHLTVIRKLALKALRRSNKPIKPRHKLTGRQLRTEFTLNTDQTGDSARRLANDEVVLDGNDRQGANAEFLQLGETIWIIDDIDRFELDPTDR